MKTSAKSTRYGDPNYHRAGSIGSAGPVSTETRRALELRPGDELYPASLGVGGPTLHLRGNARLLAPRRIAVFSSIKSTGSAILKALDWARGLAAGEQVVISGFHSPLEQECLAVFMMRGMPVIACPAREIAHYRLPIGWRAAIDAGTLLLISSCARDRRVTSKTSMARNELVAALADEIVVLHATPGGATAELARKWASRGKSIHYLAQAGSSFKARRIRRWSMRSASWKKCRCASFGSMRSSASRHGWRRTCPNWDPHSASR